MDKYHFKSENECLKSINSVSHPKYKTFKTIIKFAADTDDLNKLRGIRNKNTTHKNQTNKKTKFEDKSIESYYSKLDKLKFYRKLDKSSFNNTLLYLFYKIGSGIFVKIVDNKINMFYPFYNINYKNNWSLKFENAASFDEYVKRKRPDDYKYNTKTWSMNGCLINNWKINSINDGRWAEYYDIIRSVCKHRKVNNVEFFINYRDFPSINRKLNEPNFFVYDKMNQNMTECKFKSYLPILSCYSSPLYADYPIPSYTEWKMITKKYYADSSKFACQNKQINVKKIPWNKKVPTAVFRGSATGCGITPDTNQRLKISLLSKNWKEDIRYNEQNNIDGIPFLNAGIVSYNVRDKKDIGKPIDFINIKKLNIPKVNYLTGDEQQRYKYVVYIDGHVTAERLITELNSGSVILKVESLYKWIQWFHPLLKPYIHYVPVKKDLSDLADQIQWCKVNDDKCKKIVENALKLYSKINSKNYILDHMANIFNRIN